MTAPDRPPADVDVTEDLVRTLLGDQHPDLADLPLRHAGGGWDNEMWRLGDGLAVRMPRRAQAADLARNEHRWLPAIAGLVHVAVPVPVRTGRPGAGYPYPWSVVPWIAGTPAWRQPVGERAAWAAELADALSDLHAVAPPDAPVNPFRGGPLAGRDDAVRERLAEPGVAGAAHQLELWEDALAAPPYDARVRWLHGDAHPANLVVAGDALVGLVDFGDLGVGDPATDLATAWLTFDAQGRDAFRSRVDARGAADPAMWRRARGWAVALSSFMARLPQTETMISGIGRHAVVQLLAE